MKAVVPLRVEQALSGAWGDDGGASRRAGEQARPSGLLRPWMGH